MNTRLAPIVALVLLAAACSGSSGADSTTVADGSTTSTSLGDTTTTTAADTTTTTSTTLPPTTTTSTTIVLPTTDDPSLAPLSGIFRQPATHDGYVEWEATGAIRAGAAIDDLPFAGLWDWDGTNFAITHLDFGTGCGTDPGIYTFEIAPGGGRRLILVEDPCDARMQFLIQEEAPCQCLLYLEVELAPDEPDEPDDPEDPDAPEDGGEGDDGYGVT